MAMCLGMTPVSTQPWGRDWPAIVRPGPVLRALRVSRGVEALPAWGPLEEGLHPRDLGGREVGKKGLVNNCIKKQKERCTEQIL